MKEVRAYVSEDGQIFADIESCKYHEEEVKLQKWYSENEIYCEWGHPVAYNAFKEYLVENKDKFKFLFKEEKV